MKAAQVCGNRMLLSLTKGRTPVWSSASPSQKPFRSIFHAVRLPHLRNAPFQFSGRSRPLALEAPFATQPFSSLSSLQQAAQSKAFKDGVYQNALRLEREWALKLYPELRDRDTCERARTESYASAQYHAKVFAFRPVEEIPIRWLKVYYRDQHKGEMAEAMLDDSGDPKRLLSRRMARKELERQMINVSNPRQTPEQQTPRSNSSSNSSKRALSPPNKTVTYGQDPYRAALAAEREDALKRFPELKNLDLCTTIADESLSDLWNGSAPMRKIKTHRQAHSSLNVLLSALIKLLDAEAVLESSGREVRSSLRSRQKLRNKALFILNWAETELRDGGTTFRSLMAMTSHVLFADNFIGKILRWMRKK